MLPWLCQEGQQMADLFHAYQRRGDPRYFSINGSVVVRVPQAMVAEYKDPHLPQFEMLFTASFTKSIRAVLDSRMEKNHDS